MSRREPLSWSASRNPTSYRGIGWDDLSDKDIEFQVDCPDGVWEASVRDRDDFDDPRFWDEDYRMPPPCFLGFHATSNEAKAACERYWLADEKGRSAIRRTLGKALRQKLDSVEREENRAIERKIEKASRPRSAGEDENAKAAIQRLRARRYRAGAS